LGSSSALSGYKLTVFISHPLEASAFLGFLVLESGHAE
jgi:hypothetical protein